MQDCVIEHDSKRRHASKPVKRATARAVFRTSLSHVRNLRLRRRLQTAFQLQQQKRLSNSLTLLKTLNSLKMKCPGYGLGGERNDDSH